MHKNALQNVGNDNKKIQIHVRRPKFLIPYAYEHRIK